MLVLPHRFGFYGVLAVQPVTEILTFAVALLMVPGLRLRIDDMVGVEDETN